ncbi:MAG: AtpZ/AtpI family protein [Desulfobacterales bacterium]
MSTENQKGQRADKNFIRKIVSRQDRKLRARQQNDQSIWFGLGMLGLVGWSVAIPTVIGVAIGIWIDKTWPSRYSWTLMMLLFGLILGCLNAWFWVKRESSGYD